MENYNNNGSVWRKWDLHIHSNASDGKGTPEQIVDEAIAKDISVIALTDHHTAKNIDIIKSIGKEKGITVISGIEFRTEYGAKSVHMIGLFPDRFNGIELNSRTLHDLVLSKLDLSETRIISEGKKLNPNYGDEEAFKEGMFKVQVDFKAAANLIHNLGGIVTVHAGNKGNGLEDQMKHVGKGIKNVSKLEDCLGTVKEELLREYIDICEVNKEHDNVDFYLNIYSRPSVIASDAHTIPEVGDKFVWIKADTSFEGLKQVLYEPNERVKIQDTIPEVKSSYQIIKSVEINHEDFGKQILPFNPNLNCIIGGRSSGKSILLGCIAKLANSDKSVKKNNKEYEDYIKQLVENMKLEWLDGQDTGNRKVEYFSQSYINSMASNSEDIKCLIENILKNDELKKEALNKYNDQQAANNIKILKSVNEIYKLKYQIHELEKEILSTGNKNGIEVEIDKISTEIEKIKNSNDSQITNEDIETYNKHRRDIENIKKDIEYGKKTLIDLDNLKQFSIINDISIELTNLNGELSDYILSEYTMLSDRFKLEWENKIASIYEDEKDKIGKYQDCINKILENDIYIKCSKHYGANKAYIELEGKLKLEKEKLNKICNLEESEKIKKDKIKELQDNIITSQKYYKEICESLKVKMILEKEDVKIIPKITVNIDRFKNIIESKFNKRGSLVAKLLDYEYNGFDEFIELISDVLSKLLNEDYTLKSNYSFKDVMSDIASNTYLDIIYDVEYQGDTLSSMSEGKKAFIILRMLLDFNDNECPILIDQPEDDLDNRAIYTELVSYIKEKKKERQIILVTHNPNIVVGGDSEAVIVANQNGINSRNQDNVKFEYITGSLENSFTIDREEILLKQGIKQHVCEILEGGYDAFKNRESKYNLQM
ncbi:TrlF family AAA-like ATPase [Paraclostridium sordellii]|uniref:TrlF family AAA-like ATPase n=1 Tax=Paraclostridium sordellii TaxID=1505 RepID=UPI0005DE5730|nr:PHP domain-containing protein [Paeniclostridium sordellii]CEQ26130.1 DNA repair ATPase [[Clostridium] sordellii] [Paeniclostridium sordellii]